MGLVPVRQSVRVLPGLRLNFTRNRATTPFSGRDTQVSIGHGHFRRTVCIPGTGFSYTTIGSHRRPGERPSASPRTTRLGLIVSGLIAIAVIKTLLH
jgi:hypothetical protein